MMTCVRLHASISSVALVVATCVLAQNISTIAGSGDDGYNGDDIPATLAHLSDPDGVAVDAAGNVYVADHVNDRVRRVLRNGTITTFVGTGVHGYNGDGIPASMALLRSPAYVTVDAGGDVFIADMNNYRIRKVLANGTITTIAGTGRAPNYNGDWIPATLASLYMPAAVGLDGAGNVLIGDMNNDRVRMVFASNGTICTVAGTGVRGYNGDGIPATLALLAAPSGTAVDREGNVYIADALNQRVRKVLSNGTITTFAGNGKSGFNGDDIPASSASVGCPSDVALGNNGSILIADTCNNRVRRVLANGTITTIAGTHQQGYNGDGIPATSALLAYPMAVVEDASGRVFIADSSNNRIRVIAAPAAAATDAAPQRAARQAEAEATA